MNNTTTNNTDEYDHTYTSSIKKPTSNNDGWT